jgi:phosphonate transport system permease protein
MKTLCSKINSLFKKLTNFNKKNRTFKLQDGTTVVKPVSYTFYYVFIVTIIFIYFWNLIVSQYFTVVRFSTFVTRIPNFFNIIGQMVEGVEWSYATRVYQPMVDTIQMAILGTAIGAILSLPFAFIAAQNIIKNKYFTYTIKGLLSLVRTLPTLVYALVLAFIFGYGTFVGVLATVFFTFGIMTKMLYEYIETLDLGAFIAIEATGASKVKAFITAIIPQVFGVFLSVTLYNFEINIRSSTILGFVGAGGIGILLNDSMGLREYGRVSLMLIILLTVVIAIESTSRSLRKRFS